MPGWLADPHGREEIPFWSPAGDGVAALGLDARAGWRYALLWSPGADPPMRIEESRRSRATHGTRALVTARAAPPP